jgi:hypothetical protein
MNYDYLIDDPPMSEAEMHAARFLLLVLMTLGFLSLSEGYVLGHPLSLAATAVVEAAESSIAF